MDSGVGHERSGSDDLAELMSSTSADDVIASLCALFGDDAELYAVDHAVTSLNHYGDADSVPLTGRLRHDVFAGHDHVDDSGVHWIPVLECDQPVFVVAAEAPVSRSTDQRRAIGSLMGVLRRRFETLERTRRRSSMSVAAELQWSMLPVRADHGSRLAWAATLEPAYDVAGDLFDYAFDGGLWIYSLDGMGHGLDATTQASVALSTIRNVRLDGGSLAVQFAEASRVVRELTDAYAFVTALGVHVDTDGWIEVVDAGHVPLRRVGDDGVVQVDLQVDRPLGVGTDPSYRISRLEPLTEGEGLVLLSDGAASVTTPEGSELGDETVDRIIADSWSPIAFETVNEVSAGVMSHCAGTLSDDLTVVAVRAFGDDDG